MRPKLFDHRTLDRPAECSVVDVADRRDVVGLLSPDVGQLCVLRWLVQPCDTSGAAVW